MKAYTVRDVTDYCEGAVLVFANNSKEAIKKASRTEEMECVQEYINFRATRSPYADCMEARSRHGLLDFQENKEFLIENGWFEID